MPSLYAVQYWIFFFLTSLAELKKCNCQFLGAFQKGYGLEQLWLSFPGDCVIPLAYYEDVFSLKHMNLTSIIFLRCYDGYVF